MKALLVKATDLVSVKKNAKVVSATSKKSRKVAMVTNPNEKKIKEVLGKIASRKYNAVVVVCENDDSVINETAANALSVQLAVKNIKNVAIRVLVIKDTGNKMVISQQSGGIVFKKPIPTDIVLADSEFLPSDDNEVFKGLGFVLPE